jgi:hypothetical protein
MWDEQTDELMSIGCKLDVARSDQTTKEGDGALSLVHKNTESSA